MLVERTQRRRRNATGTKLVRRVFEVLRVKQGECKNTRVTGERGGEIRRTNFTLQVKLVKDLGVVEKFCFLPVARTYPTVGKARPGPERSTNFRTGAKSGCLLSSLRFIQQAPRNLTFTNGPREFYLFYRYSAYLSTVRNKNSVDLLVPKTFRP